MASEAVLPFLERRNYLHGTTLFDLLSTRIPANSTLSFKIARIIRSDRISIHDAGESITEIAASLTWPGGTLRVAPLPPSTTIERKPYDEAAITRAATVDDSSARFPGPSPYSFIATLIPLFKEMLSRRPKNADGGQWMFTRLDLDRLPAGSFLPLRLDLDPASNSILARCRVAAGSESSGQLYFSWVKA